MKLIIPIVSAISGVQLKNVLIYVAVVAVFLIVVWFLIKQFNPPEPIRKILIIVLVVIVAIAVINLLLGFAGNAFIEF